MAVVVWGSFNQQLESTGDDRKSQSGELFVRVGFQDVFYHRKRTFSLGNWDSQTGNAKGVKKETTIFDDLTWRGQLLWMAQQSAIQGKVKKKGEGSTRLFFRSAMYNKVVNKCPNFHGRSIV
jgi:hypothetical protein